MLSEQGVLRPDTRPESMPSPVVLRFSATFGPQGGHLVAVPRYSSDMGDAEWQVIEPALSAPAWKVGKGGRPAER